MSDGTDHCPECGGVLTTKGMTLDGNSVAMKLEWYYCLSCGWDNRSGNTDTGRSESEDDSE